MAAVASTDFRFDLGHPAVDFLATLVDRSGENRERLVDGSALGRWLEGSGIASGLDPSPRDLSQARDLREAMFGLLESVRSGASPTAGNLRVVNRWALQPEPAPQLDDRLAITYVGGDRLNGALSLLARGCIDLVTSADLERVRRCAGCTLLFVDRSAPGRRRWCSMARCGNRAKTAGYRGRTRSSGTTKRP